MSSLRLAARRLARHSGFTLLSVLTLAVGFAATAAILAVLDATLVRPLPFAKPSELVAIEHEAPGLTSTRLNMSERLYLHYRDHAEGFEEIGLVDGEPLAVSGLERPLQVDGAAATPSVFRLLRIEPLRGRTFVEEEAVPGAPTVVLVSEGFWARVLGRDPEVLGRRITVDGTESEIVGVLSEDFAFPEAGVDIWRPLIVDPETASLGSFGVNGIARLRAGVAAETAQAELQRFLEDLTTTFPDEDAAPVLARVEFRVEVPALSETLTRDLRPVLWLLLATAAFVLLLAAVNVSNLFLARAGRLQKEAAIRAALGARPGSFVRLAMAEGGLIAGTAAVAGAVVGRFALPLVLRLAPGSLPSLRPAAIDVRVLGVLTILALIVGAVFGLVALFRLPFEDLADRLKESGRSSMAGRGSQRLRKGLVVTQVAVASLLLLGAGLLVRTLGEVSRIEPGFAVEDALSFRLSIPPSRAANDGEAAAFYERVLSELGKIPGVETVGSATTVPLTGRASASGHRLKDRVERGENELPIVFETARVSPGYFDALGIPLVRGRWFDETDFAERRPVVLVSRALAETYWPEGNVLGRRIFPGTPESEDEWFEVVGVVGDVTVRSLTEEQRPAIYYPWLGPAGFEWDIAAQTVVVRSPALGREMVESVRQAVWTADPEMPLAEIAFLSELVHRARGRSAFVALMLTVAALVALALAAIGTYGVLAYLVAKRRGEFGIRMALGASHDDILRLVLREGLILAGTGAAVGWLGALAAGRTLESLLYRVAPFDPVVFSAAPLLLIALTVCACAVPARRAASVPPIEVLREE